MKLYFGGAGQGQLEAALAENGLDAESGRDGAACPLDLLSGTDLLWNLHLYVRRLLEAGIDPLERVLQIAAKMPDIVWVTDEVGCGVVPMERFEREWREAAGRVCCALTPRCERVCRVYCGILTVLKG